MLRRKNVLLFFIFFVIWITWVSANTENNILKIITYKYDELGWNFSQYSVWSAVLVSGNRVITNAHVVVWDEKKANLYYQVCVTESFDVAPKCLYIWNVVNYDVDKDLAILEVEWINSTVPKLNAPNMIFNTGSLGLWDDISVYWYPWVGGKTITYTQWKISGSEDGMYKTDTKIDAWNSGWWAFDITWKFIWIPTLITEDYDTIWWIIKAQTALNFINDSVSKKSQPQDKTDDFLSYIKIVNQIKADPYYDLRVGDWELILNNLSTYYTLSDYEENKYWAIISLYSKENKNIGVNIMRYSIYWNIPNKSIISRIAIDNIKKSTYSTSKYKCTKPGTTAVCMRDDSVIILFTRWDSLYEVDIDDYSEWTNVLKDIKAEARKLIKNIIVFHDISNPLWETWTGELLTLWNLEFKKNDSVYLLTYLSNYSTKIEINDIYRWMIWSILSGKFSENETKEKVLTMTRDSFEWMVIKEDTIVVNKDVTLNVFYSQKAWTYEALYFTKDWYQHALVFQFTPNTEYETVKRTVNEVISKINFK